MKCYVTNPYERSKLPADLDKSNTLFYPENGMTTMQCLQTAAPRDFHIVTDCPYFPSLYDCDDVFMWRDGKWVNPRHQTYGTSYNLILNAIWGYNNTIPQAVLDGKVTNCMGSETPHLQIDSSVG